MSGWPVGLCVAALLFFSADAMAAAASAARVFATGVMPALFPMMVLCRMLTNKRASAAGTVLFAFAAGSPAAAQRVRMLTDAGAVKPTALAPLLAATGVMSPMFFVGTLANWTGLRGAMWALLGVHWLGALLTAGLCCLGHRWPQKPDKSGTAQIVQTAWQAPQSVSLPQAVMQSAQALLAVCGAMMLFSIVAGVLRAALATVFPAWVTQHAQELAVVWALLEIGGGASAVLTGWNTPPLALLSGLCAFGGLSIWLQNLLFVGACIRPVKLLCIRMLHGAIGYGLGWVLFAVWPQLAAAFAQGGQATLGAAETVSVWLPALLIGLSALRHRRAF